MLLFTYIGFLSYISVEKLLDGIRFSDFFPLVLKILWICFFLKILPAYAYYRRKSRENNSRREKNEEASQVKTTAVVDVSQLVESKKVTKFCIELSIA